jgi:hypothetical protein
LPFADASAAAGGDSKSDAITSVMQLFNVVTIATGSWGLFLLAAVAPIAVPPEFRTLLAVAIASGSTGAYRYISPYTDNFYQLPGLLTRLPNATSTQDESALWSVIGRELRAAALICDADSCGDCELIPAAKLLLAASFSVEGSAAQAA